MELKELFDQRYKQLVYIANKRIYDELTAEDIVVEAFIRYWERKENIVDAAGFLFMCVFSGCKEYRRKQKVHNKYKNFASYLDIEEDFISDRLEAEIIEYLYERIKKLPERQRPVLIYSMAGKTVSWIASKLNMTHQTVRNNRTVAINNLRKSILIKFSK